MHQKRCIILDVNATELFRLGRRLMKIGVDSFPESEFRTLPTSYRIVLTDVIENPHSSITEITARTGFPQSHVSAAVAKFRDAGVFVTTVDPTDRRRTLVRRSAEHEAAAERLVAPIEPALERALGLRSQAELEEITAALELLASHLTSPHPSSPRPVTAHPVGR